MDGNDDDMINSEFVLSISSAELILSTLSITLYYALRYLFVYYLHHPSSIDLFQYDFIRVIHSFSNCIWFTEDIFKDMTNFIHYSCMQVGLREVKEYV